MTLIEYATTIARELDGIRAPKDGVDAEELIEFIWDLMRLNIPPKDAATHVIEKFGYTSEENPN